MARSALTISEVAAGWHELLLISRTTEGRRLSWPACWLNCLIDSSVVWLLVRLSGGYAHGRRSGGRQKVSYLHKLRLHTTACLRYGPLRQMSGAGF